MARPRPPCASRLCAVMAVALAVAAAPTRLAHADAPPTASELQAARALFNAAERDEDEGRWADALEKLRKVATVKATSGVRFHIALCEENLGHLTIALAEYSSAEAMATREKNKEVLESLKGPLAALKARIPELTITVQPDVAGAEVTLDGRTLAAGVVGVAMPVDPGAHRVEAKAPGRVSFAAQVTLADNDHTTVDVKLPEVPPVVPKPVPAVATSAVPPSADDVPPQDAVATRSRAPAIVATASAVALAGGGFLFFALAGSAHDDAVTSCRAQRGACGNDVRQSTRTLDALALGAWIGAAAATSVAVVLWTTPARVPPAARASASLRVGPGSVGIAGEF